MSAATGGDPHASQQASQQASQHPFQYVVLRCVPRPDREEFLNVGVVVYCQHAEVLASRWFLDTARLAAFDPALDASAVERALRFVDAVCAGEPGGGPAAAAPISQRFGYLKAPRSTVLQPGPVHGGTAPAPHGIADRLLAAVLGRGRPSVDAGPAGQTGTSSTAPTA